MAEQNISPRDFFATESAIADLGLIACPGAEELCKLVDGHLVRWAREVGMDVDTFIIPSDCPRFQSGDAKGLVKASTRGDDLYIFVDPGNYSVTYQLFGYENHLSPDEGAMNRNMYYSSVLGCNLGMFYKRRDYSRIVNGRNPIVAHEYLGESVQGKDVFIADDIIASGESMLDIAYELKMRGARNIFTCCTFPLFTAGLEKFDKAYNDGIIKAVLGTNLTYRKPELLEREWYYDVDVSKYTAYFIAAINHDKSVSSIIDPMTKIRTLLDKHGIPMGGEQ